MERYSEYKDSGVQWLGEIPGHWKQFQFRKFFKIKKVIAGKEGFDVLAITQQGIKIKDITRNEGQLAANYSGYQIVNPTDFAMNHMDLLTGYIDISKYYGVTSPDYRVFTNISEEADSKYYLYIFQLCYKRKIFFGLGQGVANKGRWRLPAVQLNKFYLPLPPLSEQHSIVSYLDDKCGKIEKMLEGKQKQIELLTEMKQRIIADAVTRGLNPNVKMKATNIPWLPEIPEHWKEQRMASLFTGEIEVNKDFEFKHAFKFNYGQLVPKNEIGDPEEYREVYVKYSKIKSGDILINGLNLNYDFVSQRVACAPSDGIITSAYVVCRPRTGVNYDYYTYLFKSMDSMKLFHGMGTGIRLTLSFKELKKQIIPIPPQSEQNAVVKFIKDKDAKFDALTSKLQQEIESIKEYKQRLISDVVTGQIKVC
jgi:type I restriction enzyme S subunit